ncbi:MAG TPA: type II toxin-antitoxin system prevent-host-death family antitoxin [Desulfuromonadales bacterium]|nr:type II toxin-antitoxin system prevent-host-death family antitoxin [Desulfuromonadales bacterium]
METVGAYEAKTHLPELLKRVAKGAIITITKHGVPVAILQPPKTTLHPAQDQAIAALRRFRSQHTLEAISLKELIEEGRR